MVRLSYPLSRRCVANECRRGCQLAGLVRPGVFPLTSIAKKPFPLPRSSRTVATRNWSAWKPSMTGILKISRQFSGCDASEISTSLLSSMLRRGASSRRAPRSAGPDGPAPGGAFRPTPNLSRRNLSEIGPGCHRGAGDFPDGIRRAGHSQPQGRPGGHALTTQPTLHGDETGWKRDGQRWQM